MSIRTFSALTTDIQKRPQLLEAMQTKAHAHGQNVTVTVTIDGPLTIVTGTDF
jgi:hypothetical protein